MNSTDATKISCFGCLFMAAILSRKLDPMRIHSLFLRKRKAWLLLLVFIRRAMKSERITDSKVKGQSIFEFTDIVVSVTIVACWIVESHTKVEAQNKEI